MGKQLVGVRTSVKILFVMIGILAVPVAGGALNLVERQAKTSSRSATNVDKIKKIEGKVDSMHEDVTDTKRSIGRIEATLKEWRKADVRTDKKQEKRIERLESLYWERHKRLRGR